VAYSTLEYSMFVLSRGIRRKGLPELVDVLASKLDAEEETFASNERLYVHQQNRRFIHYLLARMTAYVEVASGTPPHWSRRCHTSSGCCPPVAPSGVRSVSRDCADTMWSYEYA